MLKIIDKYWFAWVIGFICGDLFGLYNFIGFLESL